MAFSLTAARAVKALLVANGVGCTFSGKAGVYQATGCYSLPNPPVVTVHTRFSSPLFL